MSVSPGIDPTALSFNALAPGTLGGAAVTIASAPSAAALTAYVDGGGSPFSVSSVTTFEWRWEPVDPGELPPGHRGPLPRHRVLEPVDQSDGTTPLAVRAGQVVKVQVDVRAPDPIDDAPLVGTLVIQGDSWDSVRVPLSLTVAHVRSLLDQNLMVMPRGGQMDRIVSVRSIAGPDTAVAYSLHDGPESADLFIDPATVWVAAGQTTQATLRFHAAPEAALGNRILFLTESAFGGAQTDFVVPGPQLTVVQGKISVSSPSTGPGLTGHHGASVSAEVDVAVQGAATDVYFSAYSAGGRLPAGVSMEPRSVHVDATGSARATLVFQIDSFAPLASHTPLVLVWSAYAGTVGGTLTFPFTIQPVSMTFTAQLPFSAGDVECTHAQVVCSSDGMYAFSGSLHDHGTFAGDKYAIGFAFNFSAQHVGAADVVMGTLGAVFGPPRGADFNITQHAANTQDWVRQNWPAIFAHGATFTLQATPDLSQPFSDLIDAIKTAFNNAELEISIGVECHTVDGTDVVDCEDVDPNAPGDPGVGGDEPMVRAAAAGGD